MSYSRLAQIFSSALVVYAGGFDSYKRGLPQSVVFDDASAISVVVNNRGRYYDPIAMRFLSVDPAQSEFSRYGYGANNPYKFVDPDGRVAACALAPCVTIGRAVAKEAAVRVVMPIANLVVTSAAGAYNEALSEAYREGIARQRANAQAQAASAQMEGGENADAKPESESDANIQNSNGNDPDDSRLSKPDQRSIQSLEKRITEHQQKIEAFKSNPTVRPGMEKQSPATIQAQQQSRIQHLEKEIKTFNDNIEKIRSK